MRIDFRKLPSRELINTVTTETESDHRLRKQVARRMKNGEKVDVDYRIKLVYPAQDSVGYWYEVTEYELTEVEPKDESVGPNFLRYVTVMAGYLLVFALILQFGLGEQADVNSGNV